MGVEKNQKLTLVDYPEAGVSTNLDPGTKLVGETTLRIACDSSTCKNSLQWVLETAGENGEGVPSDAWRVLILEQFGGQKNVFCSDDCLKRWLKSYIPQLSPKEKALIETNNAKVEEKKNLVKVPIPDIPGIEPIAEVLREQSAAISQPDGFAEENKNE